MLDRLIRLITGTTYTPPEPKPERDPRERPCLWCGKMKIHNNSFCSRECCHAYRSADRRRRGLTE